MSKKLKGIFKLSLILYFIFCSFLTQPTNANQVIESQKIQTQTNLEKLKADREVFENQISDLQEKFLSFDQQLQDIAKQQAKITKNIASLNNQLNKFKKLTPQLEKQRQLLLSELYLLTDDKLFFISYFISADHFFNLLEGKDETQILIEEKIHKISLIDRLLELIKIREDMYREKIVDLKSQQQELSGRIALLAVELQTKQNLLENTDLRAIDLQKYLLSLSKMHALLERDFVGWNFAEGDTFQFVGGGTEHGLGMSQHGAAGLARLGKNYQEIVQYYYQNTHVVSKNTSGTNVRIGIVLGGGGGRVYVRGGNAHFARNPIKKDGFIDVSPSVGDAMITPDSGSTYFEVSYKLSGYNQYYGKIQFKNIGGSLFTINHINIEEYLRGVVPSEMPSSWPLEALKSQAVAARSYALYALRNLKPGNNFDMDDTTRAQVYLGKNHYASATDRAVRETAGQVAVYGAEIIPCYYHSTSGGYTENNENVWGGRPRPYLRGVPSPWEEKSPWWLWTSRVYTQDEMSRILATDERTNVGALRRIEILNRGVSGRVLVVKLIGFSGEKVTTGQTFRRIINDAMDISDPPLRSILFGIRN